MRSRTDYIVTKNEVHGYANHWLSSSLRLEYQGTKCTASTLLQILLIAAARVVSIFAVCQDLADAPFTPFSMTFTTGNDSNPPPPWAFEKEVQESSQGHSYTAVTMGPDGKLYAGTLLGEIFRFRIAADGSLGDPEPIKTLQNAEGGLRLLTGLEFDPKSTAKNPILWVTHNAFAFENAPDFSGKISRLTKAWSALAARMREPHFQR